MIDAMKANQKTKAALVDMKCKAIEWVESEWDCVDSKIEEAIARGKFEANYWWSNEILEEAGILKRDAAEALRNKAFCLGFSSTVYQNYSSANVLRIELNWENI